VEGMRARPGFFVPCGEARFEREASSIRQRDGVG
jgi:hypothetical protein